ncbi:Acetamidase/Formamidase [Lipomyces doorenjongii]|uniref:Acetamidase/Formamidase n=1 Tax=Lipomyces doorenjongii TaxID=383834 RepID=UPI0033443917
MPKQAIRTAVKVDLNTPAWEQPQLHNRWHPDIPFSCKVQPGEVVNVECLDWTGGQIGNNDSADDIKYCDLSRIHYLSGPIEVEGAEPGDVLVVEIQDVQPLPEQPWGYCAIFDKNNGGGFLDSHFPNAAKAIWDFEGIFCSSRHIPGVRFPGLIHPGIMGCMPSQELLDTWNEREKELVGYHASIGTDRVVANLPLEKFTHAGSADSDSAAKVAKEGARTIPPREHGGNCDIKNLSRGSKSYLPVYVKGAGLSIGDLHFSQGDGEISFCGAIEMAGIITIKCEIIKNGVKDMCMKNPMYIPGPVEPHYGPSRYLTFEGLSVDETGKQHYLDVNVAYKQTCLQFIEYFKKFGYSGEQLYILLSCAPVQGHIAAIVDIPNACTTLGVPVDIFEFECLPKEGGFEKIITSDCAFTSGK